MSFNGDKITGLEAAEMSLVLKYVPNEILDTEVEAFAARMATVPINQTQRLATVFDGITHHSPEGMNFKARVEQVGWKRTVQERDDGTFDWTQNKPFDRPT
jgi:enoyl-CoA hydratase